MSLSIVSGTQKAAASELKLPVTGLTPLSLSLSLSLSLQMLLLQPVFVVTV
jgi:hypothetical protein